MASSGTSTQPYHFTGEPRDAEAGLVFLRARYDDPALGRFLSRDSFGGTSDSPGSPHRYAYAHNNPVTHTDPSGHCPVCLVLGGAALVGGVTSAASAFYDQVYLDRRAPDGIDIAASFVGGAVGAVYFSGAMIAGGAAAGPAGVVLSAILGSTASFATREIVKQELDQAFGRPKRVPTLGDGVAALTAGTLSNSGGWGFARAHADNGGKTLYDAAEAVGDGLAGFLGGLAEKRWTS